MRSVHRPRREPVARAALVGAIDSAGAYHVVGDVVVLQPVTAEAARQPGAGGRAPVAVADLEQPVVATQVGVEATHGGGVVLRLVLGDADPGGYVLRGDAVLLEGQLIHQLAPVEHLARHRRRARQHQHDQRQRQQGGHGDGDEESDDSCER